MDRSAARDPYIHGTEPPEQERLAALNRLINKRFVEFLGVVAGMRVLEVGSGLGILAAEVAVAAPDVHVTGLEKSRSQIAAAVKIPQITYVQGDAHHIDFPDDSFDLVYARFVLEHVPDPGKVLREMRRVMRTGGRVAVCENDISLLRVDPPCPAFALVWDSFQRYQESLGGDSRIGSRLYRLLRSAGFSQIELSIQPEVHWHGSQGFERWIQNLIGNVESAREGLLSSGRCDKEDLQKAIAELTDLRQRDDASSHFVWNCAVARR